MAAKRGRGVRRTEQLKMQKGQKEMRDKREREKKRDFERWRDKVREEMTWDVLCPESLN